MLSLSAGLALYGLGRPKLWVDEAETALLARSILAHGVPLGRDGKDLISQEEGSEFGTDLIWRWTPWLDKYVTAGSFLLLGEGTYAARLPFALLGLAAVASVYWLGLGLFGDRRVAILSMAFLGTSVPFLLHVRQCRYYALVVLGTLWVVHCAAAAARRPGRAAPLGLAAAATVVFHANYLAFAALAVAVPAALLTLRVDRAGTRRLLLAAALIALVNSPWALFFDVAGKAGTERLSSVWENVVSYSVLTTRYSFPIAALAAFAALYAAAPKSARSLSGRELRALAFLAVCALVYLVVASLGPWVFYRYTVGLLPLFSVLSAWLVVKAWSFGRLGGGIFGALLLVTGVFHELSLQPFRHRAVVEGPTLRLFDWLLPLGNHVLELAYPFEGAMGSITDYLAEHARPGERVFVSYGDLTVRFYLPRLEVRGGQSGEELASWPAPEWIVVRRFFRFNTRASMQADIERTQRWLQTAVPWSEYRRIELPVIDLAWESIPEPHLHWFRPPSGSGEKVQIFHRTPGN